MADYHYITRQGVIVPDTADLRQGVEKDFYAAFGQDIDLSPETPQGALVTMEIENRDAMVRNNAELANQINPDIAGGIFLDAIWALMGAVVLRRFARCLAMWNSAVCLIPLFQKGHRRPVLNAQHVDYWQRRQNHW